ncbi:MAG: hypothetical protein KCHDKBKB_02362 [Elusimicrobia bacterium]|nr:hypothetical protein [Elusimicrobiota bacterium]
MNERNYCRSYAGNFDSRFALKGSTASYAPDRTFDTEHIRLELTLDFNRESLKGICTTRLRALIDNPPEMKFDAVNFHLGAVLWNKKKAVTHYKDGVLTITPPKSIRAGEMAQVEIHYQVIQPKLGLNFVKPNKNYPKRPTQAWTQGEDEYARYWFPCHDAPHERTTTEVIATVPQGFKAISNGKLLRTTHQTRKKTSTFHWRQDIPHATYLVTLAVGRFSELKESWRGKPVQYFCEKGREADAKRAFGKTPQMLEFFSKFIGVPYPFAKYAQVAAADFIYGGMENTSATTQTDAALLDERVSLDYTSDELVAHELAHQWFGDYLTCKDWSHAWLNESFATYFDPLFKRHDKGQDEFLYHIHQNAEAYFQEDKDHYRRSICTKVFKRPTDLFDRHLYEKGSVVLYMLHHQLGEILFRKAIHTYVRKNAGKVVETVDLINAIQEATGKNMRRFFDQWVFGAGHPEFKIRSFWNDRKKEINLRVTQTHAQNAETGLFAIDTEFLLVTPKGKRRERVYIEKKSHLFKIKLDSKPTLVLFDPDHLILKKVDFPKTEDQLIQQIKIDENPLGRIEAAKGLAKAGSVEATQALRHALVLDKFWGVQAEVAKALGQMTREDSAVILLHALDEIDHPKVRRAIYASLKSFHSKQIANEIEKRFRKEKSYFAETEALRTLGALRHLKHEEILKDALKKDSWNDIIRIAALEGLSATRSRKWLPTFLFYTRPGHHQRLRMAAIRCLMAFEPGTPGVQERLLTLLKDPFLLVQIAAARALHQVGDERAVALLKTMTTGDLDGRLKRLAEEAIEKITAGGQV